MAIKTVRAQVNGTWHTLTYDSASGAYTATITAPGATSFHQSGGYYNVTVEATDAAGRVSTVSRTVKLDTSVPAIQSAVITPNPVDAGATMIISVVIA